MPQHWLFKTEPADYSYDDLEREGRTVWTGVHSSLALKYFRDLRIADQILIYHTGTEKAIVGLAEAVSDPYPDPGEQDDKLLVVAIRPLRRFNRRVTLQQVKSNPALQDFDLVRLPRLSVIPVNNQQWALIIDLLE